MATRPNKPLSPGKASPSPLGPVPLHRKYSQAETSKLAKKLFADFDHQRAAGGIENVVKMLMLGLEAVRLKQQDITNHLQAGHRMVYRGNWSDDQFYSPGDVVTCAGSMFHCQVPTSDRPDTESTSWLLCVERGRDGRP